MSSTVRPVEGMSCRYRLDNTRYVVVFAGDDRSVILHPFGLSQFDLSGDLVMDSDQFERYFELEDCNE